MLSLWGGGRDYRSPICPLQILFSLLSSSISHFLGVVSRGVCSQDFDAVDGGLVLLVSSLVWGYSLAAIFLCDMWSIWTERNERIFFLVLVV